MPIFRQRRSPRLQGYDYSQAGAYFVTICCHQRLPLFGRVVDGEMSLNETGKIADQCWANIPKHFPSVDVDLWVIMPNHMHGILILTDSMFNAKTPSLGKIINAYKGAVTRAERFRRQESGLFIWQSRYHDHIIRNEAGLNHIRAYIETNPTRWTADTFYIE